ncbi:MAG: molecular chaperone DnaJ [Acidobacteria bacterium]|nr:molecular chaperone DnaJ [Acidobacteriota bacterium]
MPTNVKRDYYEVLGVSRTCTDQELKSSYRKLAMQYHPDRNPGNKDAEEKFKEASEAYSVLSDENKRAQYDRFGHQAVGGAGFGGFDASSFQDLSEIFGDIFGFGDAFGTSSRRRTRAQRGADLRADITIELKDVIFGKTTEIPVRKSEACDSCRGTGVANGKQPVACTACGGRGQIRYQQGFFSVARTCGTCGGTGQVITDPCKGCRGEGRIVREHRMKIEVPPGVEDGTRIRYQGEGEAGVFGGPAGDLYVVLAVKDDAFYLREGNDLHCMVSISFPQAALGTEVTVPTFEGDYKLKIPPGVQSGQQVPIRNKGIPVLRGRGRGDLIVHVEVQIPKKLSARQRELLEELSSITEVDEKHDKRSFFDRIKAKLQ